MVFPYLILSFLTGIILGMLTVVLIKNKQSKKRIYIPFDETPNDYNLITISAVCGEKTLKFIIDSGAGGGCIINPKVLKDIPYVKCRRKHRLMGVTGNITNAILRQITFTIKNREYVVLVYASEETTNIYSVADGLLGADFMEEHGWIIDYKEHRIYIS